METVVARAHIFRRIFNWLVYTWHNRCLMFGRQSGSVIIILIGLIVGHVGLSLDWIRPDNSLAWLESELWLYWYHHHWEARKPPPRPLLSICPGDQFHTWLLTGKRVVIEETLLKITRETMGLQSAHKDCLSSQQHTDALGAVKRNEIPRVAVGFFKENCFPSLVWASLSSELGSTVHSSQVWSSTRSSSFLHQSL